MAMEYSTLAGDSPSEGLMLYLGHLLGRVLPLCRVAVSVFYKPNQLSCYTGVSQKFCNILVVHIHGFFCKTRVSQKFCNILVVMAFSIILG